MKCIILMAGIGSRLGQPYPKCLNKLPYGETILQRQVRLLRECGINEIIGVCGFKKELIMEHMPSILYKYNPVYYLTNTSKSLLTGISSIEKDDVLWLNGDVVFDKNVILNILSDNRKNKIAVDGKKCGEEEEKYKLDSFGKIKNISKEIEDADGEAVGINVICKDDLEVFKEALEKCNDDYYFESAIEFSIEKGTNFYPVNIENNRCLEVDFHEDWECACDLFTSRE